MQNEITALIEIAHANAREKGFWEDITIYSMNTHLALIASEISEGLEAIRKNRFANRQAFLYGELDTTDWCKHFEQYIKDSFEDEMADVAIRVLDFVGGYEIQQKKFIGYYGGEMECLDGIDIVSIPTYLLKMHGSVVDIDRSTWKAQHLGELLARTHYIMEWHGHSLVEHIRWKMRYNSQRPYKHNKSF